MMKMKQICLLKSLAAVKAPISSSKNSLPIWFLLKVLLFCFFAIPQALAQGGRCGSVCIPLETVDPENPQINKGQLRLSLSTEYGDFDNFRQGDDEINNPGGNSAIIQQTTAFLDYGISEKFNLSLMIPYTRKEQQTNRFGERIASGWSDVALFGRFAAIPLKPNANKAMSIGLGVKFPTGDIEQPGPNQNRLPPAFQNGSGATDIVPTISYFQAFKRFFISGNSFLRLPLEDNKFGYEFGKEFEIHIGAGVPFFRDTLSFLLNLDFLNAGHDEDSEMFLPGRLRNGTTVLNTGGEFLEITPGLRVNFSSKLAVDTRVFVPIHEDWNGVASQNVGQVAPDVTGQISLTLTFR